MRAFLAGSPFGAGCTNIVGRGCQVTPSYCLEIVPPCRRLQRFDAAKVPSPPSDDDYDDGYDDEPAINRIRYYVVHSGSRCAALLYQVAAERPHYCYAIRSLMANCVIFRTWSCWWRRLCLHCVFCAFDN